MLGLLPLALLGASKPPSCNLPFQVAGSEATARAIAEGVIAAAPDGPGEMAPYALKLSYVERRGSWLAVQVPEPRDGVAFLGGGGLGMEIAACDGAVSDIHRQI